MHHWQCIHVHFTNIFVKVTDAGLQVICGFATAGCPRVDRFGKLGLIIEVVDTGMTLQSWLNVISDIMVGSLQLFLFLLKNIPKKVRGIKNLNDYLQERIILRL